MPPNKPHKPVKAAAPVKAELYDGINARAITANLKASRQARDIGPPPPVANRERRNEALASLEFFLRVYFPRTFKLEWSDAHRRVIERLETTISSGGMYGLAMPRAHGKTSIIDRAAIWALLSGRRKFVTIACAAESHAEQALARIKVELEGNLLLLADFPATCFPLTRLEGEARRCTGQHCEGLRTRIVFSRKRLVLPTMIAPDNEASGGIIHVCGITGAVRGLSHVDPDGNTFRPDLLLIDDPQDRESARSMVQTSERISLLNGDLLGLAGPDQRIAALITCTVIVKDDLADQLLDPNRNPAWQGERYRLMNRWPESQKWETYLELRAEGMRPTGDRAAATEFYRAHRVEMDEGGEPSWPARHNPDELSAIQQAYNLRQDRGEDAFMSEYQNEPIDKSKEVDCLDPVLIANRVNGVERYIVPHECEKLTCFIDVGGSLLWWVVCGWSEKFDCSVLDYGAFPEQRAAVFSGRNASPTLGDIFNQGPGGEDGIVFAGLKALVDRLTGREWRRSDGASLSVSRILVDAGWKTDVVRLFIRQSAHREKLTASKGIGIGPGQTAISEYHKRDGEKLGDGWILGTAGPDRLRLLRFDANLWKTRVSGMLTRPMGASGGVSLYGRNPLDHELLALHLSAEYPTRTEAKGNAVNVWTRRPDRENHLLDGMVGSAVAASLEGLSPLSALGASPPKEKKRRLSYAAIMEQRRKQA